MKGPGRKVGALERGALLGVVAALLLTTARAEPTSEVELVESGVASQAFATRPIDDHLALPVVAEPTPTPSPAPTRAPPPPPPPPPPARAAPRLATHSAAELRMLALMNASRAEGGLRPLVLDAAVSAVARAHSAVEARVGYVFHDGVDGTAASRNKPACGSGWFGENTGRIWNGNVDALHRYFMAEPWEPINHRTNIMDPNFRRAGIGAVQGSGAIFITVVFCR